MEFDILRKDTFEIKNNLFSEDDNGISYYKKNINYEYIITKKSLDTAKAWMQNNKQNNDEDKSKYINTIRYFYYIYIDNDIRCIASINSPYDFVKILILTYINPLKKSDSLLRHFEDIFAVKIKLISIIKLNDMKKSGIRLKELKDDYLKNFTTDIYTYVLNIIKLKYPPKYQLNKYYIYNYEYGKQKRCIIYPREIVDKDEFTNILKNIYQYDIVNIDKYKLITIEKCFFIIEMIVLLDKYNEKYDKYKLLTELTYNRNTIEKYLAKYGFDIYDNEKRFCNYMKQFSSKSSVNNSKKNIDDDTDKIKNINKKTLKKITKNDDNKQIINTNKLVEKKKNIVIKKMIENNSESTISTDSEDDKDSDDSSDYKNTTKKTHVVVEKTKKQITNVDEDMINNKKNKSLTQFIKNNLHKKKGEFTTVKKLISAYKNSTEYKNLKIDHIVINRTYIITYLEKYKWFNDNYRTKYKDIRSVIMNHVI